MLYTDLLKTNTIKTALEKAEVNDIESLLLKDGDFAIDFTEKDIINPSFESHVQKIIDMEVLSRRNYREHLKKEQEHEERMKPYKLLEAKAKKIRPHFQALIEGKFKYPYSTTEAAAIHYRSEQAAKKYDYDPDSSEVQSEDFSGLSGLDKLLKQASIVHLSHKMSLEEIAQREFLDAGYSSWMK